MVTLGLMLVPARLGRPCRCRYQHLVESPHHQTLQRFRLRLTRDRMISRHRSRFAGAATAFRFLPQTTTGLALFPTHSVPREVQPHTAEQSLPLAAPASVWAHGPVFVTDLVAAAATWTHFPSQVTLRAKDPEWQQRWTAPMATDDLTLLETAAVWPEAVPALLPVCRVTEGSTAAPLVQSAHGM